MRELALFAGAGGGILGGLLHGWRTVAAIEIEDYPRRILLQRQADGILPRFPIWDDVRTFNGFLWREKIDIITGGFPCQDISAAGKGKGLEGERSGLWEEMARIIREVRPKFVLVENSPMLTSRGLDRVLMDLASMGYNAEWGVLGAHHTGAPHKRDRIWIVANSVRNGAGEEFGEISKETGDTTRQAGRGEWSESSNGCENSWRKCQKCGEEWPIEFESCEDCNTKLPDSNGLDGRPGGTRGSGTSSAGEHLPYKTMADSTGSRFEKNVRCGVESEKPPVGGVGGECFGGRWPAEPAVGRVAHGVANRVDRLKAIGNGQVPAVAALAWKILRAK